MSDVEQLERKSNTKEVVVDDRVFFGLVEKAGSMGRYQCLLFAICCVGCYLVGGMIFMAPFLFYQDDYKCEGNINCLDYVCNLPVENRAKFIPDPTIHSLVNNFGDYRCHEEHIVVDFMITLMYFGCFVGLTCLALVGDLFGRKFLMVSNLIITISGLFITILSVSFTMGGIGLFVALFGVWNILNLSCYFIAETVSEVYRQKFLILIQMCYGIGATSNVGWYYLFKDYKKVLLICYLLPALVVLMAIVGLIKDTPICLVLRNSPERALKDFAYIGRMNRKEDFNLSLDEVKKIKQSYQHMMAATSTEKKNFSFLDLFRYKSLRLKTILLIIIVSSVSLMFLGPTLMIDQFGFDIFITGLIVEGSQIVGYILCFFTIHWVRRRQAAIVCLLVCCVSAIVLNFIWDYNEEEKTNVTLLILIFLLQLAVTMEYTYFYVYFNELYPTQVRIVGTGIVSAFGGLIFTISTPIMQVFVENDFKIMILFAAISGVSIVCSFMLPETYKKIPQEVIQELKGEVQKASVSDKETMENQVNRSLLSSMNVAST